MTWEANPDSFFDLRQFVTQLSALPKSDLLGAIAKMAMRSPESLATLGVTHFAEDELESE